MAVARAVGVVEIGVRPVVVLMLPQPTIGVVLQHPSDSTRLVHAGPASVRMRACL